MSASNATSRIERIFGLDRRAAEIVDSAWHYSWHWKRNEYGSLTSEGWLEVLRDARDLAAEHERKAKEVRDFIEELLTHGVV